MDLCNFRLEASPAIALQSISKFDTTSLAYMLAHKVSAMHRLDQKYLRKGKV